MKDKNGIWCNRLFTVRKEIDGTEFYFKKEIDAYLVDVKKRIAELEAKLKESEDMADASLLAVNEKQSEIFKQQSVIDLQRDKIAELEAKLQEVNELNDNAALNYADLKADLDVALEYINKPYPAPVAKPIAWDDGDFGYYVVSNGICGDFEFKIQYEDSVHSLGVYLNAQCIYDEVIGDEKTSLEEAKQAAQDWLDKLVARCADLKVPNSTGLNPSNSRGLKKQQLQVSTCEAFLTQKEYFLLLDTMVDMEAREDDEERKKLYLNLWHKLSYRDRYLLGENLTAQFEPNEIKCIKTLADRYIDRSCPGDATKTVERVAAKCEAMLEGGTNER